jgi:uncharacterized protein YrrD
MEGKTMRKSRKFISMQVISLEDGQQIGHVRGLVINPVTKTVSALQVDQKKWFKEQKIIPFSKIRSIGDDAITIEKNSNVQKPANLPEMVSLLKEKVELIGAKVIAENGITLGYVDDFYVETSSGEIVNLEISGNVLNTLFKGKAHLSMEHIRTVGKKVLVAAEGAENYLEPLDGGLQETLRNLRDTSAQILESTWEKTMDLSKNISKKLDKEDVAPSEEAPENPEIIQGENANLKNNNDQLNLKNEEPINVSAEEELTTTSNQLNAESESSPSENPTKR